MDNRGQTTFEYLLLVGGVVILAVLIIWMLTSGVKRSSEDVNEQLAGSTDTIVEKAGEYTQNLGNV